jgi:maleate isomerase
MPHQTHAPRRSEPEEITMADRHIGLIVPSSNLTMETELPRMLRDREAVLPQDRFVFHSSRMRMQHVTVPRD